MVRSTSADISRVEMDRRAVPFDEILGNEPKVLGVIWDLDGTIVDSIEIHFKAWEQVLRRHGVAFARQDFAVMLQDGADSALRSLFAPISGTGLSQIRNEKERYFRDLIKGNAVLLPGVLGLLKRSGERGLRQAVASSAPLENIESVLAELSIRSYFDVLVSSDKFPDKPVPDVLIEAARRLEVSPERCLVIEDSEAGILAAKRAKMRCIAVGRFPLSSDLGKGGLNVRSLDQILL